MNGYLEITKNLFVVLVVKAHIGTGLRRRNEKEEEIWNEKTKLSMKTERKKLIKEKE